MQIKRLDHLNIRTSRLEEMIRWYQEVLGLTLGPRPDFGFPGAWLYAGEDAIVHLVGLTDEPGSNPKDLKLEHGAMTATGFDDFIALLKARGDAYYLARVPGWPIVQVNVVDPDGNHLHIDFSTDDAASSGI